MLPLRPGMRNESGLALLTFAGLDACKISRRRARSVSRDDEIRCDGLPACGQPANAFVRIERRAANPLLPLEVLARRNFSLPLVIGFCLQFAYMGGFVISPLIMMGLFGLGQATTSLWTIARPISLSAASPVGGQLGSRYGERSMIVAGSALVFLAMGSFALGASLEALAQIVG